ncbi:MAG: HAD-IC family P-type ATPase [Devosia nanyangense]|uniref:HAD-IC family P-type ATPase n=1 Tax=Devosia nanyangense TaxID=1228055 RepID=A0A933P0K0_9HYPH|nr:HAD-IC family P-type ATPase [Devosia nanyangense]
MSLSTDPVANLPARRVVEAESAVAWHALPPDEIYRRLETSAAGLTSTEAALRLARDGYNVLPEPPRRQLLGIVIGQLRSPLIYLLLGAAALSLGMGEFSDAVFVFLVLAINTGLGTWQEARAEASSAALRSVVQARARARRDGTLVSLDGRELVAGDIVVLEAGDRVPADLRLIASAELRVDESTLTGESMAAEKSAGQPLPVETPLSDRLNCLYAGSLVRAGRGVGVVAATGRATALGQIAAVLEQKQPEPPIIKRLNRFSRTLGLASLALVVAVVGFRLLGGAELRETLFVAIALAISVIPEGLPVSVTVALSIAAGRMARRNVVVRQLPAVEGLGACTVIATDKTGTLTVNQLTAKRVWLPGHGVIAIGGEGLHPEGEFVALDGDHDGRDHAMRKLGRSAALVNDAVYDPALGRRGANGDAVDVALLVLAAKAALETDKLREATPRVAELAFSSERKFAASLNLHAEEHHLHVKGAPEVILPFCAGIDVDAVMAEAEAMAAAGHRVLAVATKAIAAANGDPLEAELHNLVLLGLVGFIDPLRPEARQAVADCHRAGVAVKMITGDHAATALAIARELGIAQTVDEVVTGRDIAAAMGDATALARIAAASVFARVEPRQKVEIVEALRAAGHFVAMTGDGVNDAPALTRADIGIAMGRDGSDAAREAADLVLTDDNFASIVAGIEEGRAAYANIRKVVYLLISTGVAEAAMFLLAMFSGLPLPLGAVQLLWLNLVTNGGQDVALAFEKPEPGLLNRPPRRPSEPIFDRVMIRQTALSGLYMGVVAYGFFAWALAQGIEEAAARDLLLFLMVLFENVQVFNARSETRSAFGVPASNNWLLIAAVVFAQSAQIAAPFIPGLRDVLVVQPIPPAMWLAMLAIALSLLAVMEADKAWARRRPRAA